MLYTFSKYSETLIWFNQTDVIVGESSVKHNIFLSFIDHNFEERRKNLKGKRRKGSIINVKYNIHPLIRACKTPDILLELAYVRKNRKFC